MGDGAVIGGHAAVHQFARVGSLAFVAANAMVSLDIPPYCMAAGDRARLVGLNTTGLKRADIPHGVRQAIKSAFRALFIMDGGSRAERAQTAAADTIPEVAAMARFVLESTRGVTAARRASDPISDGPIH